MIISAIAFGFCLGMTVQGIICGLPPLVSLAQLTCALVNLGFIAARWLK